MTRCPPATALLRKGGRLFAGLLPGVLLACRRKRKLYDRVREQDLEDWRVRCVSLMQLLRKIYQKSSFLSLYKVWKSGVLTWYLGLNFLRVLGQLVFTSGHSAQP